MRAGTIVATNYLEMARLLGRSYLAAHPDSAFTILLVDDHPAEADDDGITIVRLDDLGLDTVDLDLMRTIYDVMELSTAVKPAFLARLLDQDELACYIDPDVYVYQPFEDLLQRAHDVGIVLTPHVLEPIPRDGLAPTERMIMQSGVFNLGFIAVGRTARPFLDWWQERLLIDAVSDVEANLFTDQRWVDWLPALFDAAVCRDPGMNIAWWNIHERHLERADGTVLANGTPVRFVHFSGYSPADPDTFSKHQGPDPRTAHQGVIRELAEEYGEQLLRGGHGDRITTPYQWSRSEDGLELTSVVRSVVRRAVLGGARTGCEAGGIDRSVPLAFGPTAEGFREWLTAVDERSSRFTRVEVGLWEARDDVRAVFPDREGRDADAYEQWLAHDPGARQSLGGLARPVTPNQGPPRRTAGSILRGLVRRGRAAVAAARA